MEAEPSPHVLRHALGHGGHRVGATGESLGRITISVGVAAFRHREGGTVLLERADQCMYVAKRTGRNRTVTDAEHSDAERVSQVAA